MLRITRQDLIHKTTGELSGLFRQVQDLAASATRPSAEFNALQDALRLIRDELRHRGPAP
ncbi:MAG: hypothetical protein GC152_09335 [Alphaproteobacteria bacterium]|nr:hypothetical protein [Alphaproteobacteria bacterium]